MKKICDRVLDDLKMVWLPLLCIVVYILVKRVIFHREVCFLYEYTGFPCPFCGITRAAGLLLQGDFIGAFWMHPFIYPLCLLAVLFGICRYMLGKSTKWIWPAIGVLIVAAIIFYVYRLKTDFPKVPPMVYNKQAVFYHLFHQ